MQAKHSSGGLTTAGTACACVLAADMPRRSRAASSPRWAASQLPPGLTHGKDDYLLYDVPKDLPPRLLWEA